MTKNPFEAIQLIRTSRPWLGLSIALLVFLIAVGLRYLFNQQLYNVPFITLFPAILISALVGGLRVGLLVAVLSAITAWLLFLPPSATTALHWPDGYLTWALFALTCFIQLSLVYLLHQAIDALTLARDRSAALFQELQHRVANNLQFVAAMLRMKRRVFELDPSAAERLFESAQSRLDSMARIHRELYSPQSLERPISDYLEKLGKDIIAVRGLKNVKCHVRAVNAAFDLERRVTLGLLVNEFITNSLKHAFTGREEGNIHIILEQNDADHLALTVKDDGHGLPDGFKFTDGRSLGLNIMNSLALQLGGELSRIEVQEGAAAHLVFPAKRGDVSPMIEGNHRTEETVN